MSSVGQKSVVFVPKAIARRVQCSIWKDFSYISIEKRIALGKTLGNSSKENLEQKGRKREVGVIFLGNFSLHKNRDKKHV